MKISEPNDQVNVGKKHFSIPIRVPKYTTQHHHVIPNTMKHTRPIESDYSTRTDMSEAAQPYKFPHLQTKGSIKYIYIYMYMYIYTYI